MTTNGVLLLDQFNAGKKLSRKGAMLAKCADCMCRYINGRQACQNPSCPMFPFMPYRDKAENRPESGSIEQTT